MRAPAKRAGAVAAIGTLSLLAPILGVGTPVLFGAVAIGILVLPPEWDLFDALAVRRETKVGRLETLGGFALAVTGLSVLATVETFGLSSAVFAMSVVLVAYGTLGGRLTQAWVQSALSGTIGYFVTGTGAAIAAYGVLRAFGHTNESETIPLALFLAITGALLATLMREDLHQQDDALVVVAVGLVLWLFAAVGSTLGVTEVGLGLIVTFGLGAIAYATKTASVSGMLSGILLGLITFVLGGFEWFIVLVVFFAVGGLSTKYRYDEKAARGVAEDDQGRRGTANVMSNGLVSVVAVTAWAASEQMALPEPLATIPSIVFLVAFAGAVATALADTLASEIGVLYDQPRLITSFKAVEPGTDGAITLRGQVAGIGGACIVGALSFVMFPQLDLVPLLAMIVGGFIGMTADSLLGATVEGRHLANEGVNLIATLVGATVAGVTTWIFI